MNSTVYICWNNTSPEILTTEIRSNAIVVAAQQIVQQLRYICMVIALGEPRGGHGCGEGGVRVGVGAHLVQAVGIAASLDAVGRDPDGSRSQSQSRSRSRAWADGQVPGIWVNAQREEAAANQKFKYAQVQAASLVAGVAPCCDEVS